PETIASTLRIDVFQGVLRLRIRAGLREIDRGVDELLHFPVERFVLPVRETELLAQELDRIGGLLESMELVLVPIDLRIADVMPDEALGFAEQEHRALAVARMLERAGGDLVHLLDVLAVDLHRLHPERLGALAEVADRRVLALRRRFGPVVAFADEHGRNLPELSDVERLVERADVRRPIAEEGDCDPRLAAELEGKRGAHDRGQTAADDGIRPEIPALDVVEVHRTPV